jgi:hypothetical protein
MTKLFLALSLLVFTTATAQAQAPFFQGKTITIVVGTKTGDAYDLYPRMLAEFMPKYIPGGPNIDDVRKLRDRIRPAPGNLQREQFDLGKIPFTVP